MEIVVLGEPGDGVVVAEAIHSAEAAGGGIRCVGFLNDVLPVGETIYGLPVLGKLEHWAQVPSSFRFIPAIQKVKDMRQRSARVESLGIPRDRWATVIHPTAYVASDAQIGVGVYIASSASVSLIA